MPSKHFQAPISMGGIWLVKLNFEFEKFSECVRVWFSVGTPPNGCLIKSYEFLLFSKWAWECVPVQSNVKPNTPCMLFYWASRRPVKI